MNTARPPQNVRGNARMMNTGGGKLLLISDLEGCATHQAPTPMPANALAAGKTYYNAGELERIGKKKQTRIQCDTAFFKELERFLEKNPKNKVAFLGDYFDLGDMALPSILEIMKLFEMYGIQTGNNGRPRVTNAGLPVQTGRVTILLGNRDANKLRLIYEMQDVAKVAPDATGHRWPIWKGFYDNLGAQATPLARLIHILGASMGAYAFKLIMLDPSVTANNAAAAELLMSIFMKGKAIPAGMEEKVNAVRNLLRVGKVVHMDDEYKTLMSHAGGMDAFFFHEPAYYTESVYPEIAKSENYYEKIELTRKALMVEPSQKTGTFVEATYNAPYEKLVKELLGGWNAELPEPPAEPSNEFYLVQALGLKPDADKHFTSFIQSCDNQGCKGPVGSDMPAIYDNSTYAMYQDKLVAAGVKVVAAGHSPHCAPVPMVYKRPEEKGILFVACDTSNGFRPTETVGESIDTYPLAFVDDGGSAAGAGCLVSGSGTVTTTPAGFSPDWSFMLGSFSYADAPTFMDTGKSSYVQYATKKLTFPSRAGGGPFQPAVAAMAGGRRKAKMARKTRKSRKAMRKQRKTRRR